MRRIAQWLGIFVAVVVVMRAALRAIDAEDRYALDDDIDATVVIPPAPWSGIDPTPVVAIALDHGEPVDPTCPSLCGDPLCWCGSMLQVGTLLGVRQRPGVA